MLATPGEAFDSPDHFFEVKWDGIRALAYKDGDSFWMETRNFKQALPRFPELRAVKDAIKSDRAVIDGEIVVFGASGLPDFDAARARNAQKTPLAIATASASRPAVYIAFDCLVLDGKEIMPLPFSKRRDALLDTVRKCDRTIVTHGSLEHGRAYFEALAAQGLEGMVAKALKSPYIPGTRSKAWIKVRDVKSADCVVAGYSPNGRDQIKSLIAGLYNDAGDLLYVGHVGTGFSSQERVEIRNALERIRVSESPLDQYPIASGRDALWVRPCLVCRIEYLTLTQNGHLRHPTFKGFRTDKDPEECLLAHELGSHLTRK